jgi:hypothetical protein
VKAAALGAWLAKRAPSVRCLRLVLDMHTAHDIDRWGMYSQQQHQQRQLQQWGQRQQQQQWEQRPQQQQRRKSQEAAST